MQIEIKESAIEHNEAVADYAAEEGRMITIDSRAEAEALADGFSKEGEPVGLQQIAPQDSTPADVYLVYRPTRQTHNPIDPDAESWTFETTANQYGAIGEALLTTKGTPALQYFIQQDLDRENIRVSLKSTRWAVKDGTVSQETLDAIGWSPDAVAFAYGMGSVLEEYWCEIKTGDASFERRQTEGMLKLADIDGVSVLKIRVWIDDLPEQYSVRIEKQVD